MSGWNIIDLKEYFNHKFFYAKIPKDEIQEYGIDGIGVLKSNLTLRKKECINGVDFGFEFGALDNIECAGQRIKIEKEAKGLQFFGFACWGTCQENIKIVYEDSKIEKRKLTFADWFRTATNNYGSVIWYDDNVRTEKIVKSFGGSNPLIYFHGIRCCFEEKKKVKEIVLPDNVFIHVFAISVVG